MKISEFIPVGLTNDGDPILVGDIVPDERAETVYEDIERLDEYTALHKALDSLPPDLREVIREYYFEQLTFKQIGERHDFSLDRAYQLHNKAIRELRKNRALAVFFGN